MGKTALIVVDMLNDFLDPGGSLYVGAQAREIIPFVAQKKIAEFRAQGGVVIFVCDAHAPDDREFRYFRSARGQRELGSRNPSRVAPGARRLPGRRPGTAPLPIPTWTTFSRQEQVEEVHVVGVMTSICVMETVKELFDRDLPGLVYRQGVGDWTPRPTPSP